MRGPCGCEFPPTGVRTEDSPPENREQRLLEWEQDANAGRDVLFEAAPALRRPWAPEGGRREH